MVWIKPCGYTIIKWDDVVNIWNSTIPKFPSITFLANVFIARADIYCYTAPTESIFNFSWVAHLLPVIVWPSHLLFCSLGVEYPSPSLVPNETGANLGSDFWWGLMPKTVFIPPMFFAHPYSCISSMFMPCERWDMAPNGFMYFTHPFLGFFCVFSANPSPRLSLEFFTNLMLGLAENTQKNPRK